MSRAWDDERRQLLDGLTRMGDSGRAEGAQQDQLAWGFYPVAEHLRLLDPDVVLVVGPRGSGKTQITRMLTRNTDGAAPTDPTAAGVYSGTTGIYSTPSHLRANEDNCAPVAQSPCSGGTTGGSIIVPAGANGLTYWIESIMTANASKFSSRITWRLLTTDCKLIRTGEAFTSVAIAPRNCDGDGL